MAADFVVDGRPDPDDAEEILQQLVDVAAQAFDIDDVENAVTLQLYYKPIAEYLADQQQELATVLDSSQIDHADGTALGLLSALIGVSRQDARAATGDVVFSRGSPAPTTYPIPQGTQVQTDEADPLYFRTTEPRAIKFIDGFEDNDIGEYNGDTTDFDTVQTQVFDGSYALFSDNQAFISDADETVYPGDRLHWRTRLSSGASSAVLFGVQSTDDYYAVEVDEAAGELRMDVTEGGATTALDSTSVAVPADEWLHVETKWDFNWNFEITLYDSAENELAALSTNDSSGTFFDGGIGFESRASAGVWWDNLTMSEATAPVRATTTGVETNVGSNTLIVFSDQPAGTESVSNPQPTAGGQDRENDEELRARAKEELAEGMAATIPALISSLRNIDGVRAVDIVENDEDSTDGDGRPPHSFEAIIDNNVAEDADIAQEIIDTKAAGTNPVGGYAGTAVSDEVELLNGQLFTVEWTEPTPVQIYVDADIEVTDTYAGDDAVRQAIAEYIGGTLPGGTDITGELVAGDDVIYNQVLQAIVSVEGVYDVTALAVDTDSTPTSTTNEAIAAGEAAFVDGTDSSIEITASDV
jgi:uncharacterized phage protein gp47/JayE